MNLYLFEASTKKLVSNSSHPAMKPTVTADIVIERRLPSKILTSKKHDGKTKEEGSDGDGPSSIRDLTVTDDNS